MRMHISIFVHTHSFSRESISLSFMHLAPGSSQDLTRLEELNNIQNIEVLYNPKTGSITLNSIQCISEKK